MRAFGFSFASYKTLLLFLAVAVVLGLGYRHALQSSVRAHSEAVRQVVEAHCRHVVGKNHGDAEAWQAAFAGCSRFELKSVEVAGGLLDAVIVRVAVVAEPDFPLTGRSFVFKSMVVNFHFLAGLGGLMSGKWAFNPYNTYSDLTFQGSI